MVNGILKRVITGGGGNVQDQMIGVATSSNVLTGTSPYPQSFTYGVGYIGSGQINRAVRNQTSLTALSVVLLWVLLLT